MPGLHYVLVFTYLVHGIVEFVVLMRRPDLRKSVRYYGEPFEALLCMAIAITSMILDHHVVAGLYTFVATMTAYLWWHDEDNKRRRKKLRERLARRVKEMGGRLKVVARQPN